MDKVLIDVLRRLGKREIKDEFILCDKSGNYDTDCGDCEIVNRGSAFASVNGYPLNPGDSVTLRANVGELRRTKLDITYNSLGTLKVYIIKKAFVQ